MDSQFIGSYNTWRFLEHFHHFTIGVNMHFISCRGNANNTASTHPNGKYWNVWGSYSPAKTKDDKVDAKDGGKCMPDIRTGFTGTQVDAEPESSEQGKKLACYKIHLCGRERGERERLKTFICPSACVWILSRLSWFPQQGTSETWTLSSAECCFEKVQETDQVTRPSSGVTSEQPQFRSQFFFRFLCIFDNFYAYI